MEDAKYDFDHSFIVTTLPNLAWFIFLDVFRKIEF